MGRCLCSHSVQGIRETRVITGRSKPARSCCSPGSARDPSEPCTKGNGTVREPHTAGEPEHGTCSSSRTFGYSAPVPLSWLTGDVAVKILKVTDPTPEQFQAFRNEVAVLRWDGILSTSAQNTCSSFFYTFAVQKAQFGLTFGLRTDLFKSKSIHVGTEPNCSNINQFTLVRFTLIFNWHLFVFMTFMNSIVCLFIYIYIYMHIYTVI